MGFGNWCVRSHRLAVNPFAYVPKADVKADCRRRRRALTEAELVKLINVARRRPLLEAMTIRRGKNKGKPLADVKAETRERLERLGRERALIYKTLVLTGLRRNELASITTGQLELDGPYPIQHSHSPRHMTVPSRSVMKHWPCAADSPSQTGCAGSLSSAILAPSFAEAVQRTPPCLPA